jgi:hypothetical protein
MQQNTILRYAFGAAIKQASSFVLPRRAVPAPNLTEANEDNEEDW